MPGIEPLDNTPGKINIDQRLASVLGHEMTTAPANKPVSRCRRHLPLHEVSNAALQAPTPVKELLLNRPIPQHAEQEKENVPTSRSKVKSISFQMRMCHILCNKKKMSKNSQNYSIRLMTKVIH